MIVTALLLFFLESRFPAMLSGREFNVDEGNTLAQVLRYREDFMPWRSADGTSSGPMIAWYLMAFQALGVPFGYGGAHAVAALTWAAVLLGAYAVARKEIGTRAAIAALLIGTMWLAQKQGDVYVHYCSEAVPALLLCAALYIHTTDRRYDWAAALVLGLVPWAKLQAVPIALTAGVYLVFRSMSAPPNPKHRWSPAALLIAASVTPTIAILAWVAHGHALQDFWASYILGNLDYAGPLRVGEMARHLRGLILDGSLGTWVDTICVLAATMMLRRSTTRRFGLFAVTLLAVSIFSCVRSPFEFEHYQLLLLPALILLTAWVMGQLLAKRIPRFAWFVGIALAAVVLSPLAVTAPEAWVRRFNNARDKDEAVAIVKTIRHDLGAAGPIVIWGWRPSIYVADARPAGTRYTITHFLFGRNARARFMRSRFIEDIERTRPEIILDTSHCLVERIFGAPPVTAFPELEAELVANYSQKKSIWVGNDEIRVFRRHEPFQTSDR